jgi:hypothetical protein
VTDLTTFPLDDAGSFSWLARPAEPLRRASTALAVEGGWILVDAVDHLGLEEALAGRPVLGISMLLDRHRRDTEPLSERLGVPVLVPGVLAGQGQALNHPEVEERVVLAAPGWNESAFWLPRTRLLVCADALGTVGYFLAAEGDPIGVHPALRLRPPVGALGGLDPAAVAVGHGPPVTSGAAAAVERALATARSQLLRAWGRAAASSAAALAARLRGRER